MPRQKVEQVPAPVEGMPQDEPMPVEERSEPVLEVEQVAPAVVPASTEREPVQGERRAAALAHGSILLNLVTVVGGTVMAFVIWLLNDRKSKYVSEQALQAVVFQTIALLLTLVFGTIAVVLWLITAALLPVGVGICLVPFALGFTTIALVVIAGSLIYGCAGALAVLDGRDFHYRGVSDWIHPLGRP